MAEHDYAIVVGIQRYPRFGANGAAPNDLQGPDTDAELITEWLLDPAGGAVPRKQLRCIRSADFPDPFPPDKVSPVRTDIIKAFRWLDRIADKNNEAGVIGRKVGRRLYLYVSGHGFARERNQGTVYTADATRTAPAFLEASEWAGWLSNTMYFDEQVLWMDTCMTDEVALVLGPAGFRPASPTVASTRFATFAARWPLRAVESRQDDAQIHGAFTWALLRGLLGAAADPVTGEIRSGRLRDYLTNAMRTFMSDEQRNDTLVSKEPDFGFVDDLLIATIPAPGIPAASQSKVRLAFPAATAGASWEVVTGSPSTVVASGTVQANLEATIELPSGIFLARVVGGGPFAWVEVTGQDRDVTVA
jgi:uncharacterized caspase-like protein